MLQPGEVINGKYRIIRLIGDGGMGSVYEARHEVLGSHVALKFLHPEISKQAGLKQRFLQEAKVSATVQSPHICRVSDVDTADEEGAYIVMDLLRGEPLQALIDRSDRIDLATAIDFTLQMLEGLKVAHKKGVVHRDLKPDNVFLVPGVAGPTVVLLDFGIAKLRHTEEYQMTLTRPGAVMGTPEYMAPEQAYSADLVDQRSDLFSVGVILFEMLSGKRPTTGDNPQQIAEKIITGQVERLDHLRPDLPLPLVAVVHRAIEGDPDKRWASAVELAQALAGFRGTSTVAEASKRTGLQTPFMPVSKTPVVGSETPLVQPGVVGPSVHSAAAPRGSTAAVPPTVPPVDDAPPQSQFAGSQASRTASMPATSAPPAPGHPRTVDYVLQAPAGRPAKRKSRAGVWVTLIGLLLVGAAGGSYWYYERFHAFAPPPPPQPRLRSERRPETPEYVVPADLLGEEKPRRPSVHPSRPPRKKSPGKKSAPRPPPITLPTNLPPITLPTSFPTALPSSFPFPITPP